MVDQLNDLLKEISEDLRAQIEANEKLSSKTKNKLEGLGINPDLPIHEIVRLLSSAKMNLEELKHYYFGGVRKPS